MVILPDALNVRIWFVVQLMAPETVIEFAPLTVRLFPDKWPLTTLTLMSALPPLIVMVFPLRLQLEPDVPVWPVVLNVKT